MGKTLFKKVGSSTFDELAVQKRQSSKATTAEPDSASGVNAASQAAPRGKGSLKRAISSALTQQKEPAYRR